jgi:O-antigen/teichoic acid export membrane protein
MARLSAVAGGEDKKKNLLRTYELIYLFLSIAVVFTIIFGASSIALFWLKASSIPTDDITHAIRWMGLAIGLQMPAGLFMGGLMGLQKQVMLNILQIGWGLLRAFGAVFLLHIVSNDIITFSISQAISNFFYCILARSLLWRNIHGFQKSAHFDRQLLITTWKYASGMAIVTFLSIILTQEDKIFLSKFESLRNFGYYSLASSLAAIPLSLAGTIGSAFFPRLTFLVNRGDTIELKRLYHYGCQLINVAILPLVAIIFLYSNALITSWTGSSEIALIAGKTTALLAVGQGLQAITVIPYYTLLSFGMLRLNIGLSISSIIIITPILYVLVLSRGLEGAGLSWVFMNLLSLPAYMYLMHRSTIPGEFKNWLFSDLLKPLIATIITAGMCKYFFHTPVSRFQTIIYAGITWLCTTSAIILVFPEFRNKIVDKLKYFLRVHLLSENK